MKVYIINSITKSYILNIKIRPLVTEYTLMIKLVDEKSSAHSLFNPYVYFGHSWSYFEIQNLRLVILYLFYDSVNSYFDYILMCPFTFRRIHLAGLRYSNYIYRRATHCENESECDASCAPNDGTCDHHNQCHCHHNHHTPHPHPR